MFFYKIIAAGVLISP